MRVFQKRKRYFFFFLFSFFSISLSAQGDSFCTSTSISAGSSCITQAGSTVGFSDDLEFSSSCFGNEDDEGWYWISGGSNGNDYTIEITGTGGADMVFSVVGVDGVLCDTNGEINCVDDTGINGTESITFTWNSTWDYYYIQVYEYYAGGGDFDICVYESGGGGGGGGNGENDCVGAIVICDGSIINYTPTGPGIDDFANPNNDEGCILLLENESAWYYFEMNSSTPLNSLLEFTLTPVNGADDYDFAIFGPNATCDDLGSPIRCSWADSSCGFCPETGLGMGATDLSEGNTGDGFLLPLTVNAGEGYYLLIDNFSTSASGFDLAWGGDGANYLDCNANPSCTEDAGTFNIAIDGVDQGSSCGVFDLPSHSTMTFTSNNDQVIGTGANAGIVFAIFDVDPSTLDLTDPATFESHPNLLGGDPDNTSLYTTSESSCAGLSGTDSSWPSTVWVIPVTADFASIPYDIDTDFDACVDVGCITQINYTYENSFNLGCGDSFTDTGGATDDYCNNEDATWTICPDNPGDVVTVTFTSFETEGIITCYDPLTVYDGQTDTDPLIGSYCEPGLGPFTSTDASGCLYFTFTSDAGVTEFGWEAMVSCTSSCNANLDASYDNTGDFCANDGVTLETEINWNLISFDAGPNATANATIGFLVFCTTPDITNTTELQLHFDAVLESPDAVGDFIDVNGVYTDPINSAQTCSGEIILVPITIYDVDISNTFFIDWNCYAVGNPVTVTLETELAPDFTQLGPYCVGDSPEILPTSSNNGIDGTWDGVINTSNSGSFTFIFTPDVGFCATSTTMNIVINDLTSDVNETYNGCQGDGYSYTSPSGTVYNEGNPNGIEVLQDGNNCDYTVTVDLTFNPSTPDVNETYNGCQGDGYSYTSASGTVYNEGNPNGIEILQDGNNCDYTITVDLTFNPSTPDVNETYNGCQGDGYSYTSPSGTVYNEGNPNGIEVLQDGNNCDYTVTVDLTFNPSTPDVNETYNGCQGDGYSYTSPSGTVYNEGNPNGIEVLQDGNNCDYTVTVDLTFNSSTPDVNEIYNGCQGDGYSYTSPSGTVYNEGNPNGIEVLQDGNNCDYTVTVDLTFNPSTPDVNETYNGCQGDGYSYTSPSGTVYNEGNPNGIEVLQDGNNCDYTITVDLTFNPSTPDVNETYNGCQGDGYSYTSPSGTVYNEGNPNGIEVLQDGNNCDYTITVDLTFNPSTPDVNETYNGCQGDGYSYTSPSGTVYNEGNPNGIEILQDGNNCDYTITVDLTFNPSTPDVNETYNGCQGDGYSYTSPSGTVYNEGNPNGIEILQDGNNCDYTITVDLTFNPSTPDVNETYNGCQGDGYSYTSASGTVYNEGNPNGIEILQDGNNCDYTITVDLTFNPSTPDVNETYNGCQGDGYSYTSPSGTVYNEGNPNGIEVLQDGNNCDYTITVDLTFNPSTPDVNETYNGCQGDGYSYTSPSGTVYNEGNPNGIEILQDGNNCDYTVTVDLTFNPSTPDVNETYNGCQGDGYSYTSPSGMVYNEGNPNGIEILQDGNNCDYTVTVDLTFNTATSGTEDYEGCTGDGYSVLVNNQTYNENNPIGVQTITNQAGCDSTVIIDLIFNSISSGEEIYEGCFNDGYSVSVNGTIYNEFNPIGIEILTNTEGCDSIVNINLQFNDSVSGTENYEGCIGDGYSVLVNGSLYNEAFPNGTETLTSNNGCDSIVTIDLVFNNVLNGEELYNGCEGDGYSVLVNNVIYDELNPNGTETLVSNSGCDSIVVIDLVFNPILSGAETYLGCTNDGYAILVNGLVYNEGNPNGSEILQSSLGCDSLVIISLVFQEVLMGEELYTGCIGDGYSVLVNSVLYDENNPTGSEILTSTSGCDSLVSIGLVFGTGYSTEELYTGCSGDGYNVIVNGMIYDEFNSTGEETMVSTSGCDSIITVNLIFNNFSNGIEWYDGCVGDGYSVMVNGQNYNENNPAGVQTLTNSNGCDSTVVIDLVFNDPSFGEEIYNGCFNDGYSVTVNGTIYNELNPIGTETLINALGCDSIVNINLQYNNSVSGTENYTGCNGDGYSITVNGVIYNENNPIGEEMLISASGCDSIVTIDLTFNDVLNGTEIYQGCQGDGYSVTVNGVVYDEVNPSGSETLVNAGSCDSLVTIDLVFNAATSGEEVYTGCNGDGYAVLVNGIVYNEGNPIGTETLVNSVGCDSLVSIGLIFGTGYSTEELYTGCSGDGYNVIVNGMIYNEFNPTGEETMVSTSGCDSIITVNLIFNNSTNGIEWYDGCVGDGYSVVVNGQNYNENNPAGVQTLTNSNGCDSTVVIDLVFNDPSFGEEVYNGCFNDGYSVTVNGTIYNELNPIGTETLINALGCDSIVNINLQYNNSVSGTENYTGCNGDGYSITVNGVIYNENNPIGEEMLISASGCDSIVTIDLTFNDVLNGTEIYQGCQGDGYSVTVNGVVYDEVNPSGSETLVNAGSCDSLVTIDLIFNAGTSGEEVYTGCNGDGYAVLVNGIVYNEANPAGVETLVNSVGCDSLVSIALVFGTGYSTEELYTGCSGDSYNIIVNGMIYDEFNPTGEETMVSTSGCDSIITVNLIFNNSSNGIEWYDGCVGDGYSVMVNGQNYNENNPAGVQTLSNSNGCDSTVVIDLVFNDPSFGEEIYNGCFNDGYSVTVNGTIYNELNPVGTETLINTLGCDSIVNINLQYNNSVSGTENYTGCNGDGYSITVNGIIYNENNPIGAETLTSTSGCDSIVTINLTFNDVLNGTETYQGCQGDGYSVTVNGIVYDEVNPSGLETLVNAGSCDSLVTIDLIFNAATSGEEVYTGCNGDGYAVLVNGIVYNEANPIGTETLVNSVGCDSLVSIGLIFGTGYSTEELYTGCSGDGYNVIVNGMMYNEFNPTGEETMVSTSGCDSIITVNLIFNNSSNGIEWYDGCVGDGYSVAVNGTVYNELNPVGTEVLINTLGCDSIVNINLQYNNSVSGTENYTGCNGDGYSIIVNGVLYNENNPAGSEILTGANGCDSIITIDLQFTNGVEYDLQETLCADQSITVNGTVYGINTPSGTEIITAGSVLGCDSIINVTLDFYPIITASINGDNQICLGDSTTLTLLFDGGTTYNVEIFDGTNTTNIDNITSGYSFEVAPMSNSIYSIVSLIANGVPCTPIVQTSSVLIEVSEVDVIAEVDSDYGGYGVECNGDQNGIVSAQAVGGVASYTYEWNNGMEEQVIENLGIGTYIVTISDALGCSSSDQVVITEPPSIVALNSTMSPNCFGENNGFIQFDSIVGGLEPYIFSIDGLNYSPTNSFNNLAAGEYILSIQDVNGCEVSENIQLDEPALLELDLGEDQIIQLGESIDIEAVMSIPEFAADSFFWTTIDPTLTCLTCFEENVSPFETTNYMATVIDQNGCMASDDLTIRVQKDRNVYIPSAFSPNGDGANDFFTVFAGDDVLEVQTLNIYDRWGEVMFINEGFLPNVEVLGWDGTFRSQRMNPGVYIYFAKILFVDGRVEIFKGDITLIK